VRVCREGEGTFSGVVVRLGIRTSQRANESTPLLSTTYEQPILYADKYPTNVAFKETTASEDHVTAALSQGVVSDATNTLVREMDATPDIHTAACIISGVNLTNPSLLFWGIVWRYWMVGRGFLVVGRRSIL